MSITLDLPEGLETELSAEARRLGLSLSDYILRLLASGRVAEPLPTTGADLIAYWQKEGVIGSRPDIADSQEHARQIRHQAERRTRE